MKKILIVAGGTGGHVIPGLAIASVFQADKIAVEWMGTLAGVEATLVPEAGIELHTIGISGLRRKGLLAKGVALYRFVCATRQAVKILKRVSPDLVLGFGGYVSAPGGCAARLLKIPLVIHEQNSMAGLTNRLLSRMANTVLTAYPNVLPHAQTVGNPVRGTLLSFSAPVLQDDTRRLRVLVLGGSRGAKAINELVVALVKCNPDRFEFWHQTGATTYQETTQNYGDNLKYVTLCPYIDDMAAAYRWSDVVLCRAGAMTVFEVMAVGRAAIFIPYPFAVDDHQCANAMYLVGHNAAQCVSEASITVSNLYDMLLSFEQDPVLVHTFAQSAYQLRQKNSALLIKQACMRLM
jgi:UDP-N-acetylglucosamine--N-acetylmuramyl-(pentapeptide) pyrophosphoryl-undecaprenol N-acetylglucosamine transferase